MKIEIMRFLFSISLLCFTSFLFAQNHDNIWLMGRNSPSTIEDAGVILDFSETVPEIYYEFRDMHFYQTNASISDSIGNLLFYTNGVKVFNYLNELVENGQGLNPGLHATNQIEDGRGYQLEQGAIIIPVPENDSLFYLIHKDLIVPVEEGIWFSSKYCYYSLINMNSNNDLGAVIEKNQILLEGIYDQGKLIATKHANGRDWWLFVREYDSNKYIKLLITPTGIVNKNEQEIGISIPSNSIGQAVFSPDGSKYANIHLTGTIGDPIYVSIYDFDRCSGELNNPIQFMYADSASAGGIAISPNSRFLYVSSFKFLYQYDLWAADIELSKDTIAEWDGFLENDFFATTFYLAQLAPDNKIYINSNNSVSFLHVINSPDFSGESSDVCQHCVELPARNSFSMPNFPNYRLNYLEGSPCDTLRHPPTANWDYEANGLEIHFQDSSFHDIRSWSWDFGDGDIDSIAHPTHEYEEVGEYEVCLVVENPRGIDTLCQTLLILPSSIDDNDSDIALTVFPNPTEDKVMVEWHGLNARNGEILIYNSLGQLVWRKPTNRRGASDINLSEWPNGLYWMQLKVNDEIIGSKKLLKQ